MRPRLTAGPVAEGPPAAGSPAPATAPTAAPTAHNRTIVSALCADGNTAAVLGEGEAWGRGRRGAITPFAYIVVARGGSFGFLSKKKQSADEIKGRTENMYRIWLKLRGGQQGEGVSTASIAMTWVEGHAVVVCANLPQYVRPAANISGPMAVPMVFNLPASFLSPTSTLGAQWVCGSVGCSHGVPPETPAIPT